jgi:membrane-associated phospholipid phosphatase
VLLHTFLQANFWQEIVQKANQLDKHWFLLLNKQHTATWLDHIMPVWREASTWVPLYVFLILFGSLNMGKNAWKWIVFSIIAVAISDQISSGLIKNWVARPRPCSDAEMQLLGRLLLNRCPSSGSFTSSHATNHFTIAMFWFLSLQLLVPKKWLYLFFVWAASICYGQVYVGVHYPLDVVVGALLGCTIGLGIYKIYNTLITTKQPSIIQTTS